MPLRIGIVGCGKIADGHAAEIRHIPGAALVAACDSEPLMAEQLAVRHAVPRHYPDIDRMLGAEALDVLHITTPPDSHPALAEKALKAGCHLFVEKPFALDARAGRAILDHAQRAERKVCVNYWYNFEPQALELRRMCERGVLGDVVHVDSHLGYSLGGDFGAVVLGDPGHWVHRLPGKLFHNVLDHIINKIAPFLPDDVPEVATLAWRGREAVGDPEVDAVSDELRFIVRSGRVSGCGTFCARAEPVAHFARIFGTKNTTHVDFDLRTITIEPRQTVPSSLGRLLPAFAQARQYRKAAWHNVGLFRRNEFSFFAGMRTLIGLFYDSVRDVRPVPIPYAEILKVMTIMDAIIAQANQQTSRASVGGS